MLGYLSLAPDGNTVKGLRFYAHAETPGLGDQIDKEPWRALWVGKQVYGSGDEPQIRVVRGPVPAGAANPEHLIDGMAGATLTGNGVNDIVLTASSGYQVAYLLQDAGDFVTTLSSGPIPIVPAGYTLIGWPWLSTLNPFIR